jgi:hypothetical protein
LQKCNLIEPSVLVYLDLGARKTEIVQNYLFLCFAGWKLDEGWLKCGDFQRAG